MDYDVIVVGGGPSGSTAAAYLARHGIKTLLLDRKTFPREKACGDAVPTLAVEILQEVGLETIPTAGFFKANRVLHRNAENEEAVFDLSDSDLSTSIASTCYIAPRHQFDQIIYDHALACGAVFEQCSVTAPLIENDQVVGVCGTHNGQDVTYRARMVIAADGATSAIARAFNSQPKDKKLLAVSIRGYIETDVDLEDAIEIDFLPETLPNYAWFFPTSKRSANIGLGIRTDFYDRQQHSLEELLEIYRNKPQISSRVGSHAIQNIKSWQLPFFSFDIKRVFSGLLLAGDAGHFINPITGDGIYEAVVTGKCAAQAALKALEIGDFSAQGLAVYDTLWLEILGTRGKQATLLNNLLTITPNLLSKAIFGAKERQQ